MELKSIKAVGFDLDGTLINSREAFALSFVSIIDKWGLKVQEIEVLKSYVGLHLSKLLELLGIDISKKNDFINLLDSLYPEIAQRELHAFEGATATLDSIKSTGKKLALITSNSSYGVDLSLKYCGIDKEIFDFIVTSCDVEKHKPDPEPITKAMSHFAVDASEFLYVGDSVADYEAAVNAKTNFKLMTHPQNGKHDANICVSHHVPCFKSFRNEIVSSFS